MKIKNFRPSTFFSRYPVTIRDGKRNVFYHHPNEERNITFNLPEGEFFSEHKIEQCRIFIPYPLLTLPKIIRSEDIPTGFFLKVGNNPHKASIDLGINRVKIDTEIFNHPFQPVKYFVCGHEVGHHIFNKDKETDEINCDRFSYNMAMLSGFNPIQMKKVKNILFKNNPERNSCFGHAIDSFAIRR